MSQVRAKSIKRKIKNVKSRRDVKKRRAIKIKKMKKKNAGNVREISKARFEALSYARIPLVKSIAEEIQWFSNENNAVLGALLVDKIDNDFVAIVMGRDEVGVFRLIDCRHSIEDINDAREVLFSLILFHSESGAEEYPQGVSKRKKNLIFEPVVKERVMHEDYKVLTGSDSMSPAKELIQEMAYSFEDPDGNYIEQFQSSGFNPRLWELYLYALFHELDFTINRDYSAPDYVIEKLGIRFCVEAVTVNPSQNGFDEDEPKNSEEMLDLLSNYIPIKYGSPLFSKLNKKYWEKKHVAGNPFAIAIHDFHQRNSMMWSRPGLEAYLYGVVRKNKINADGIIERVSDTVDSHQWKGKEIPSNFFAQPGAENISAVIHSNQATIGKFLRMGYLAEFGRRDLEIRLKGRAIIYNNDKPVDYDVAVTDPEYNEFWKNSVTIYHNPNAKNPLNPYLFEGVAQVFFKDGEFRDIKPPFYPLDGRTMYRVVQ